MQLINQGRSTMVFFYQFLVNYTHTQQFLFMYLISILDIDNHIIINAEKVRY